MPVIEVLIILLLIALNGVLAMSEIAMISARPARLRQRASRGDRGARIALRLIRDPSRFLSTVQIGITLVGVGAGAFGGATLGATFGRWLDQLGWIAPHGEWFGLATVIVLVTYLSLVIGELVPKRIALIHSERIAALVAPGMYRLSHVAAPAVWLLRHSCDAVLRPLGLMRSPETTVTEEEVKALIAEATQAGVFVPQERDMIDGVLRMAERSVDAIMTPRARVLWLDRNADRTALLESAGNNPSARLLVCDGTIDRPLGVIPTRDLLPVALCGDPIHLEDLLAPVLVVPQQTPILQLLERFKRERVHVAVVSDTASPSTVTRGLVTLTDVLMSIADELPDRSAGAESVSATEPREPAVPAAPRY